MPRRIQGPDGKIHEFPDDFTDAEISSALDTLLPPAGPTGPEGSALSRFGSNLWDVVNPVAAVKGVYDTLTDPVAAGKAVFESHKTQLQKARQAFADGRYSEVLGHTTAAALPLLGPIAADAGEQIGTGDVAGGLGRATGVLAPFGFTKAARSGVAAVTPLSVADKFDAMAAGRYAEVMSPKSSAAKGLRMTAKAEKIAPELAKDTTNAAWSRSGLKQNFEAQLDDASTALDEAADARNAGKPYETAPVVAALRAERAKLTAQPFEASHRTPVYGDAPANLPMPPTRTGVPLGNDVVPHHNKATVAEIDRAIAEIEALGPIAPYEALRRIRASYDKPAQVKYNPAVTPDYLANQSVADGAANVTGVIREVLAHGDPTTAAANARYSLYKNARDIVTAAEELEKARPKVGRKLMSRLTATVLGGEAGGAPGALAGFALGPTVDALMSAGVTTQLQTAKLLSEMAKAIRGGNETKFLQLQFKLKELARAGAKAEVIRGTAAQAGQPQSQ